MKRIKGARGIALAAAGCLLIFGTAAPAQAEDYLGSLKLIGTSFCPHGSAEAAGQILPISQNTALFSLLGTTYGGDGKSNFALPDLSARAPVEGSRYCIWLQGIFPSRP
jgi:microcystin-dependent protein